MVTVRIVRDIGLGPVASYAEKLGIYEHMPQLTSYALGAGETELQRLVGAYAAFANGGHRVDPIFVDRIQDRRGTTIYRSDTRRCVGCASDRWLGQERPYVPERGKRVLDPVTAFQITWLLEGVVNRGTGKAAAVEGLPVVGKTGSTNGNRDAWFIGYTPEIVAGCYIGYDEPRTLGSRGGGGSLCAPVIGEFFAGLPESARDRTWRPPAGVTFAYVDPESGVRVSEDAKGALREAFRADNVPDFGHPPARASQSASGLY